MFKVLILWFLELVYRTIFSIITGHPTSISNYINLVISNYKESVT